jgi:hypothetical protein
LIINSLRKAEKERKREKEAQAARKQELAHFQETNPQLEGTTNTLISQLQRIAKSLSNVKRIAWLRVSIDGPETEG